MTYKCITLLYLTIILSTPLISDEVSKDYYLHSIVQQTINEDKQKALDLWIDFLYETNDTIRRSNWVASDIEKYGDDYCLFQNSYFIYDRIDQLSYFVPFILSIEKIDSEYTIRTMFMQKELKLSEIGKDNQQITSIVKVKVIEQNGRLYLKNVIDDEVKKWNTYKTKNINYIVNNDITIDTTKCKEAQRFLDSLSRMWDKPLTQSVDYYVSNSSESINRIVGFDFSFFGGFGNGMAGRNGRYLFVGNEDFTYYHELVHLVFNGANNRLLSEGIATYFGGTNGKTFAEVKSEFRKKYYQLDKAKIAEICGYPGQSSYYVLGSIICELIVKEKGIKGIRTLLDTIGNDDFSNGLADYNTLRKKIQQLLGMDEAEFYKQINDILEK